MKLHCDSCQKPLGEYLYGVGGIDERAVITNRNNPGLPDVVCHDCWREGYTSENRKVNHTDEKQV